MGRIFIPGGASGIGQDVDPRRPVTYSEWQETLEKQEKDFDRIAEAMQLLSVRFDAFIRFLSASDHLPADSDDDIRVRFDVDGYYQYTTRMQNTFIPYLVETIQFHPTIVRRCERARKWNTDNPDMTMKLEDLSIFGLARMATPDDLKAMQDIPASETFWQTWEGLGGERHKATD